jgi:nitroreductase/NAD-dependent dihydropyrimidine dehydrogenase PreA subunit
MPRIAIDSNTCKRDGLCTMACIVGVFQQDERGAVPRVARPERCFGCGHCVAICPSGAVSHSSYPEDAVGTIAPEQVPTYEQVLEIIRSRRSKRKFEDRPVDRADVEKVLEAARFAPSAHNAQSVEYVVVQDRETLHRIAELTVEGLLRMLKPFRSRVGRALMGLIMGRRKAAALGRFAPEMDALADLFRSGNDLILHEATTLIVFHADDAGASPSVDANLALQNAALAAEALGLGCFYGGFVLAACGRDKSIPELLSLPATHEVYGVLAMGYPKLKYRKWPERRPARVRWV